MYLHLTHTWLIISNNNLVVRCPHEWNHQTSAFGDISDTRRWSGNWAKTSEGGHWAWQIFFWKQAWTTHAVSSTTRNRSTATTTKKNNQNRLYSGKSGPLGQDSVTMFSSTLLETNTAPVRWWSGDYFTMLILGRLIPSSVNIREVFSQPPKSKLQQRFSCRAIHFDAGAMDQVVQNAKRIPQEGDDFYGSTPQWNGS